MFTGRRPRAFQFRCCVDTVILGQAIVLRKVKENRSYRTYRTCLVGIAGAVTFNPPRWNRENQEPKGTFHAKAQRSQRRKGAFEHLTRLCAFAIFAPLREKPLQLLVRRRVR